MSKYYLMTVKTCYMCKDNNGMQENGTPIESAFKKCDHKLSVGLVDLRIQELEEDLKALKKAKRYAKLVEEVIS